MFWNLYSMYGRKKKLDLTIFSWVVFNKDWQNWVVESKDIIISKRFFLPHQKHFGSKVHSLLSTNQWSVRNGGVKMTSVMELCDWLDGRWNWPQRSQWNYIFFMFNMTDIIWEKTIKSIDLQWGPLIAVVKQNFLVFCLQSSQ